MVDIGLKFEFPDPESSFAFARELERADGEDHEYRIATFDPKLNFDANTLLMVLKVAAGSASAVAAFIGLVQAILKVINKPSVKMEIDGKQLELHAKASPDDVKQLCDILLRAGK
ncbi:MAG: hypothetical protein P4M09_22255 [Devosia sp.]|nr:hypothetical protein [Devosia sp.]